MSDRDPTSRKEAPEFISRKEAATYLSKKGLPISYSTLANKAKMKNAGNGPPFTRYNGHRVRYKVSDLDVWLAQRLERVE